MLDRTRHVEAKEIDRLARSTKSGSLGTGLEIESALTQGQDGVGPVWTIMDGRSLTIFRYLHHLLLGAVVLQFLASVLLSSPGAAHSD